MGSIVYALAAGNAVVFKPSELTPAVVPGWSTRSPRSCRSIRCCSLSRLRATGAALCRSGVDKLAFTGSTETGKRVMAACAETLTPVVIECGGKDALIVDADADLDAAADAALWAGMSNAGQTCVGVERVYAVDAVVRRARQPADRAGPGAATGEDRAASYGPMTLPSQVDVVRRHVEDALARGGRAVVGGVSSRSGRRTWTR